MKKEKQQKRPKRTKAQRVQALKTFAVDTVYDVVGSILFAIGVYTFAKSADFAPGGVSGLALICNYLWDLPIGTMTLIINIPIIIISYKVVGRKFLLKSFKTMVISTLFLDLVFPLTPLYKWLAHFFGSKTYEAFHFRTVFKQDQCRNADYTKLLCKCHILIYIYFSYCVSLFCQFFYNRTLTHTWTTPCCPEIYKNRFLRF